MKIPRFLVFLALATAITSGSLGADDRWNKARSLAQKADRLIQQKRFDEAVAAFSQAEEVWPDGGYYATRLGSLYRDREDLSAAMQHYDRALTQGGDKNTYTLRERGIALCRARRYGEGSESFEAALRVAAEKQENVQETMNVLGYYSICKRDEGRYKESVDLADRGFALQPGSGIFTLNEGKLHSEVWLGHEAMVGGRYQEAANHYAEAEAVGQRSALHREWIQKTAEVANLKKLAEVRLAVEESRQQPEYIHRVQVFYIKKGKFDFVAQNGKHIVAEDSITDFHRSRSEFFLAVLKRHIEAMSGGRLTLEFKYKELDVELTELKRYSWNGVEVRAPELDSLPDHVAEYFCRAAAEVDTFWIFWPGKGSSTTANGGANAYPCVPYQLYTPMRGYVAFPADWMGPDAPVGYMHEFFHNVETMVKLPVTHGFLPQNRGKFPGWRGNGQLDYFLWQFQNTVPGLQAVQNNFANLNYLVRHPNYLTSSILNAHRSSVQGVSSADRKEAKRLSAVASELYWQKRNPQAALLAAENALALFPGQRDAILIACRAAYDLKDYQKVTEYTMRLNPLPSEAWLYQRLASLQQWQLKDLEAAAQTYELIAARFPENQESYANYGRALMDLGRNEPALAVLDKGRSSTSTVQKPTVAAQSAFWKGYLLGEKMGRPEEALALVQEAVAAGYNDSFVQSYLKKYSGGAPSPQLLRSNPPPAKIPAPDMIKPSILH